MKSLTKSEVELEVNSGTGIIYASGGMGTKNGRIILVTRAGYFLFTPGEIGNVNYLHLQGDQLREYTTLQEGLS
jgi:hypothetical protein